MTLLFMDGFDHYATADITKKWTATSSGAINASSGRRGGGAFRVALNTGTVTKTLAATASWVVGGAIKFTALPTSFAAELIALLDAGSLQCNVKLNVDGTLSVTRNGTALTDGTSVYTLSAGSFYYIEFKVTIANSIGAGTCKVRVNGVDVITVATGQDVQATANASANQVRYGTFGSATVDWDDVYICDQSGSTNNDLLGDVRIDTIFPTSDGNYAQFTPSTGTDHYALVDETAPNTTDYNDGAAVGDRDSYGLGNLSALTSQTVYGVQVNAATLKDDAGAKSAATFVRSSSTDGDGASVALGTSQTYISQVFETDPNGSIAWTETTVNAMEAGVKVTA
jgi:hypothetical protein